MNKLPVSHLPGILFIEYNRQFFFGLATVHNYVRVLRKNKKHSCSETRVYIDRSAQFILCLTKRFKKIMT